MTLDEERQMRFAHKLQQRWFAMVANRDRESAAFGYVVDAVFENDPIKAVQLSLKNGISQTIVDEMREVFEV